MLTERDRKAFLAKHATLGRRLVTQEAEVSQQASLIYAMAAAETWLQVTPCLERNESSRLHKLAAAIEAGRIVNGNKGLTRDDASVIVGEAHSFVIQHDWASAFDGAADFADGEWKLPYTHCAFEFVISGRPVIVIAFDHESLQQTEIAGNQAAVIFVSLGNDYWYCGGRESREEAFAQFAWRQVRAISIALDAEVAVREIVRAPAALNAKRARSGKEPLNDFHVVRLNGRHRKQQFNGGGTHKSPRLHFRRGHWRHYESFKTWIRWTLAGNPALGFIDKDYRL